MKKTKIALVCVLVGFSVVFAAATLAVAQQVTIGTPLQGNHDSFSESIGSSWSVSGKNWFLNFGGGGANPQFGGNDPSGGLNVGTSIQKGDVTANFRGWASQGSDRSSTMSSPSVTMMNGQQAYVGDVSEHPFVTGVTPVVGNYNRMRNSTPPAAYNTPLQERLQRMQEEQQLYQKYSGQNAGAQGVVPAKERTRAATKRRAEKETAAERSTKKSGKAKARSSSGSNRNAGTAERPARSVAEMKRQFDSQQVDSQKTDTTAKKDVSKGKAKKSRKSTAKKSGKKSRSKKHANAD